MVATTAAGHHHSPAHLIVTLPPNARTSRRRIAKEIGKVLRIGKIHRQKKNNRIIYVEVESADGAQWFCLEKNGRLDISGGCQVRIDTTQTRHCQWEVKEGPSPQRSRLPSVRVEQLRHIFNNYEELCSIPDRITPLDEGGHIIEPSTLPRPNVQPGSTGLGLAPPYHLLPDTPYFRTAVIIPPPMPEENLPTLQRITNRYLASIQQQDEREIEQLEQWLIAEMDYYREQMEEQKVDSSGGGGKKKERRDFEAIRRVLGWSTTSMTDDGGNHTRHEY